MRRLTFAFAALVVASASASAARAQQKAEQTAPKLVPPTQLHAPPVPYPEGAKGEATVTLEIVVDEGGEVASVDVVDGAEPFSGVAKEAAEAWRFAPATREGTPVNATIRAKVSFVPPPPPKPPEPPAPAPKPPPKAKKPKASDPPADITIEGERTEVAQTTMGGGEVRLVPGAFGDPFRAIEAMPGVVPVFNGLPFFYIRGAPPGNTGYFVDGVRVPMLFHLGAGPSVVAPGIVDRVAFFPSAFPARFGRFTGGIVAGETTGPPKRTRGEWNLRLFDASASVETPVGEKGDVLIAGRYGYPALLLNLLQSEVSLQYWDYQLRGGYRTSDRDRVSAFVFGAFDRLVDKRTGNVLFDVQFHRADVRFDRALPDGKLRVATTLMFDQSGLGDDNDREDRFAAQMLGFGARLETERRLSPTILFRGGGDLWVERYRLVAREDGGSGEEQADFFPTRTDVTTGVRADFVMRPTPAVEIVPGVRLDAFTQGGTTVPALDPRLALRLRLARRVHTVTTLGVAHQLPSFVIPAPALQPGTLRKGLQEVYQYAQGVEVELPAKLRVTTTVFANRYRNMTDAISVCGNDDVDDCDDLDVRVAGHAYGLEVLLKRDLTERIGAWLAYTLSRSVRSLGRRSELSDFDRTHVLSAAGSAALGKGWRFGTRFSYQTGRPYLIRIGEIGGVDVPVPGTVPPGDRPLLPSRSFRRRLPAFWRLDLRLEKRWVYSETRSLAFVIEWFNVGFVKEPTEYDNCTPDGTCRVEEVGPVTIPSLGLEGTF